MDFNKSWFPLPLFNWIHERLFRQPMGKKTEAVVIDLFYVGTAMVLAAVCSYLFNILAGRMMGPSAYGEFTLVQSLAVFLSIPMQMGFTTAIIKYTAEKVDKADQQAVISTTYFIVLFFTVLFFILYFLFSQLIIAVTGISSHLFYYSMVLSVFFVLFSLAISTLRGLLAMKKFSRVRPVYNVILLASLLVFVLVSTFDLGAAIFSMSFAYAVTGIIILGSTGRKYLKFVFDKSIAFQMIQYSIFAVIGAVSAAIFMNVDKLLIDRFMSVSSVGIYEAYYWGFLTFSSLFSVIFVTVIFPVASASQRKEEIIKKINKIVPILAILGFPVIEVFGFIIILMYGQEYPFNLGMAILFGIAAIVILIDGIYVWLMNAVGNKGVRVSALAAMVLALVNTLLNIWLIPILGLNGAVIAKIVAYIFSLSIVLSKRNLFRETIAV